MRKALALLLIVLTLAAPAWAAEADPTTLVQLDTVAEATAIDATYSVLTENVQKIDVTFPKGFGYADAGFNKDTGKLKIGIADSVPINTEQVLLRATATLTDGTKVAPKLELTSLKLDGKNPKVNVLESLLTVAQNNGTLTVSAHWCDTFPEGSYSFTAASYAADGRMQSVSMASVTVDAENETFSASLPVSSDAAYVKAYFLTPSSTPFTNPVILRLN